MIYTQEDYEQFYNEIQRKNRSHGWQLVTVLLCAILLAAIVGCDAQDAANIAQDETEAHQRHIDTLVLAGVRKFTPTARPLRASDMDFTVTACQQLPNRTWECQAQ